MESTLVGPHLLMILSTPPLDLLQSKKSHRINQVIGLANPCHLVVKFKLVSSETILLKFPSFGSVCRGPFMHLSKIVHSPVSEITRITQTNKQTFASLLNSIPTARGHVVECQYTMRGVTFAVYLIEFLTNVILIL